MYFVFKFEAPVVPQKLPISGRRGADKLQCLARRIEFLRQRIDTAEKQGYNRSRDKQEGAALAWAIKAVLMYETLLKKGPESDD